jgi:perosamine synthetase
MIFQPLLQNPIYIMITQIEPWIDNDELIQLKRIIDSTFVVEHDLTKEFEQMICDLTGAKFAITMTNGTMALFCCIKALGIKPGDEVIIPNMTFIASANAVLMAGAVPVFCDICEDTFCINIESAKKCISSKTKAIMPVHLYGQSADMTLISQFADDHNLYIIEDAAQGVGVKYNNNHVGTLGDCGILSFYGNKTITCGEGGVILTNNEKLRNDCYKLKNHGRLTKGTFIHEEIGYNFCFTEMQAAIGISQLNKLSRIINKKNKIYARYLRHLSILSDHLSFPRTSPLCDPVYWFTSILTERKNELKEFMSMNNIQTRDFFYPMHLQPCYKNIIHSKGHDGNSFCVSKKIYNEGLSLPSSYNLSIKDQDYVIHHILKFFNS